MLEWVLHLYTEIPENLKYPTRTRMATPSHGHPHHSLVGVDVFGWTVLERFNLWGYEITFDESLHCIQK